MESRSRSITLSFAGGWAAILLYLGFTSASWWLYPGLFTPRANWLSDLGNPARNPAGAAFYNVGCILTAAALLLFVLGLSRWRSGVGGRHALLAAAQVAGVASVLSLAMLGVHSEDSLREHMFYSNWFFACFPVFTLLLSTALVVDPRFRRTAILGFGVVVVGLFFHALFPRNRPMEWATELGFLGYVALVAWSTQRAAASLQILNGPSSPASNC